MMPSSTVSFNVIVPNSSVSARQRPHAVVPSASLSVAIALDSVNGTASSTAPAIANLSASTAGCEQTSTQLSCVVNVSAPVGALIYTLTVYSAAGGGGSSLGAGNLAVTTTAGATVVAPATLYGTVAKIVLTVGGAALGASVAVTLTVQAEDTNNNTVLGNYTNPITLTDNDPSGQTTLSSSATNITSGALSVTLAYKGGTMSAPAVIDASALGVSPGSVTIASFSPDQTAPTVNGATTSFAYSASMQQGTNAAPNGKVFTSSGTYTVTVATGQSFNGVSNLVQMSGLPEADPGLPSSFATCCNYPGLVAYFAWTQQSAASSLGLVGMTSTDLFTLSCAAPYNQRIITPLPSSWDVRNDSAPCTQTYDDNMGDTDTAVINADGSYADTGNLINQFGYSYRVGVNSDGSATQFYNIACGCGNSSIVAVPVPSPGAALLPVTITYFPGEGIPPSNTAPTPAPISTSVPNPWIAAGIPNGAMPIPLESDTFATVGAIATLPAQCAIPASLLGSNPTISEAVETVVLADPMQDWNIGYYTSQTINHYYLDGVGEVCSEYVMYQVSFDSGPTSYYVNVAGNPDYDTDYVTTAQTVWIYATASTLTATAQRRRLALQAFSAATSAMARAPLNLFSRQAYGHFHHFVKH
ncbi:MAG: hypothetical protein WA629_13365 [Candidatus Aquilonibacter sp.]